MARQGQKPQFVRTIQVRNENRVGVLASVIGTISDNGGDIGDIRLVSQSPRWVVRDIDVTLESLEQLDNVLTNLHAIHESRVLEVRDEVLAAHVGGKIRIQPTRPLTSIADLGRIYTPGVGQVCRHLHEDPSAVDLYTMIGNTVAIVTDGTAILGLGNLGPQAGMPVMEGKSALLAHLVGINGIPILLRTTDPEEIAQTVANISPAYGVIQLEDIASPHCFEVEELVKERVDIPVFHDDQQGTAAVVVAALLNACKVKGLDIRKQKIGQIGLGAAGLAIAKALILLTGSPVLGADLQPDAVARLVKGGGQSADIEQIMGVCDVVIATTGAANLIKPAMIRRGQIIFALSNPRPEIDPDEAEKAGALVAASGSSINNLLCYPGVCRGLLDARATRAIPEMFQAASETLVDLTDEGSLLPGALDKHVHAAVAAAVARVALEHGLARREADMVVMRELAEATAFGVP
ncbi:MAG: malic enzyme-like NAD(P)-binding protein [Dehalococcoidia bacterium]